MASNTQSTIITAGARVRIVYKDHSGEITERVIDVERIFTHEKTNNRLIVAFCNRRQEFRTFDANRIIAAMPDDSVTVSTFGMSAALGDAVLFHRQYEAMLTV